MHDPGSTLKIALTFLKFRPRTVFELTEKLKSKNISQEEIDKTLEVLTRNKLLGDAEFAKMWVRDRNLFKPSGSFVLKLELRKLGVSDEDIETALENQDEEALARKALESKSRYRNAEFNKQAQFLQRRGFNPGIIFKILKKN
ncbi:TPA: RecX family transcriptional regulator [Candidatus Berkelbacteria bacterium]|uniref:Regulatory protein RecX n=1 Tax=Berkelbacteria bacterium GW2011_GWE1_39_12 TaxID=1618337 RepID=A0A0G4B326_9BACT|nr:MAG: regulatory protein RecX [Berkelbacteria bacterium GW2011_GWE1_39_12]HBO60942.1 RecX family transcriptional regulator [Candidatus Berkelbacteria bacterium]